MSTVQTATKANYSKYNFHSDATVTSSVTNKHIAPVKTARGNKWNLTSDDGNRGAVYADEFVKELFPETTNETLTETETVSQNNTGAMEDLNMDELSLPNAGIPAGVKVYEGESTPEEEKQLTEAQVKAAAIKEQMKKMKAELRALSGKAPAKKADEDKSLTPEEKAEQDRIAAEKAAKIADLENQEKEAKDAADKAIAAHKDIVTQLKELNGKKRSYSAKGGERAPAVKTPIETVADIKRDLLARNNEKSAKVYSEVAKANGVRPLTVRRINEWGAHKNVAPSAPVAPATTSETAAA